MLYYNNIKRVFLWVHDILPFCIREGIYLQTHKTKFKTIIAVSNWQKNHIVQELKIPESMITVSRNAIMTSRFSKNITKIPYRFISISDPSRGLDLLVENISTIKIKYPLTTLYIFADIEKIKKSTLEKILNTDYIFLENRLKQEEIAIELLKSDIFFYPCTFPETYCISVVEAMISKCLIVTTDYAGLGEIVKHKAITVPHPISDNIDKLINKLYFVLERPDLKDHFIKKSYDWAYKQSYKNLAEEWIKNIF